VSDCCGWPKCRNRGEIVYHSEQRAVFLCDTHWAAIQSDDLRSANRSRGILKLGLRAKFDPSVQPMQQAQQTEVVVTALDEKIERHTEAPGEAASLEEIPEVAVASPRCRRAREAALDFSDFEKNLLGGKYDEFT
jgi:hypothetical protein